MNINFIKRSFVKLSRTAVIVTGATSFLLVSVPTSPTHATPQQCTTWPSPNTAVNPRTVRSVRLYDRTIQLRAGNIRGIQHGWAKILNYRSSDRVWMDVSNDGGRTWIQCGPFYASRQYTPAYPTSSSSNRKFRACGDVLIDGTRWFVCTAWW